MREYYLAEKLKNRHTSAGKLIWMMPLLVIFLAAALTMDYFTIDCYNWWYTTLFPGMIAFLCGAAGERDKKLGNRAIWTLPADMGRVWDGKVLYGIRGMGIALLILMGTALVTSTVMEQILHWGFQLNITPGQHLLAVLVLFVTSLWQVPFCLFLQQIIGTFPMVFIHLGIYTLCDIWLSLKPYFMALPGGIAAREMCIVLKILPNGLVAESGSMTFTPELLEWQGIPLGIAAAILWFFVLWVLGRKWFERKVEI